MEENDRQRAESASGGAVVLPFVAPKVRTQRPAARPDEGSTSPAVPGKVATDATAGVSARQLLHQVDELLARLERKTVMEKRGERVRALRQAVAELRFGALGEKKVGGRTQRSAPPPDNGNRRLVLVRQPESSVTEGPSPAPAGISSRD